MATIAEQKHEGTGKYLVVYLCILALAGLQFLIAYQNITASQMFRRMLSVSLVEAAVAVMFFMHLWSEKRGFLLFVVLFTIFVLLSMQFGWTDSFPAHALCRILFVSGRLGSFCPCPEKAGPQRSQRMAQRSQRKTLRVMEQGTPIIRPMLMALVALVLLASPLPAMGAELRALLHPGCFRGQPND